MADILEKFFKNLSARINKENSISDIFWTALQSSDELLKILLKEIDIQLGGRWEIQREYYDKKTNGRPDFLFKSSLGDRVLIEIKLLDRNYHFKEYSKITIDNIKPKIVLISSHEPLEELPGWTVILWNDLISKMEQSKNEFVLAFSKYLRRATMSEKIKKVSFQKPIDILYLNRILKHTIQNYKSEKCICEIYPKISSFAEDYSGYCFFIKLLNGKELDIWLYFTLVYYEEYQGIQLWIEGKWTKNYDTILSGLKLHYKENLHEEGGNCFILMDANGEKFREFINCNSIEDQLAILENMFREFINVIEKTI